METHRSIVIVPSRTIDKFHEPAAETQAYEERLLCLLLMLRDPELQVVYVTSLAGGRADRRLLPLAARPRAGRRRARAADDDHRRRRLRAPAVGQAARAPAPARRASAGRSTTSSAATSSPTSRPSSSRRSATRSASRSTAPTPRSPTSAPRAARASCSSAPASSTRWASSGSPAAPTRSRRSRACAPPSRSSSRSSSSSTPASPARATRSSSCAGLPRPGSRYEKRRIGLRFDAMQLEALGVPQAVYLERLSHGGVVEERIAGLELRSPSVQLELTPGGEARIVSTHDQILSGQRYLGCRFPAEPAYARAITESARRVGALLAEAGARGRAGIDFVVARDEDGVWHAYAIEVNLRSGGTTHPLAALELLSGGVYDADTAIFTAPVRLAAALRGDRPPRVAAAAGARPRRPAAARGAPAAGGGRLRRRLPHAQRDRRARPRRADRDRHAPPRTRRAASSRRRSCLLDARRGVRRSLSALAAGAMDLRGRSAVALAGCCGGSQRDDEPPPTAARRARHARAADRRGRRRLALARPGPLLPPDPRRRRAPTAPPTAQYIVRPSVLEAQMQALDDAGYTPITGEALRRAHGARREAAAQADPAHLRRRVRPASTRARCRSCASTTSWRRSS